MTETNEDGLLWRVLKSAYYRLMYGRGYHEEQEAVRNAQARSNDRDHWSDVTEDESDP